jgi:NADP-dependent 3-hydroxy acid dehydrogenase YdfG
MSTDGGPEAVVVTGASAGVGRATVRAFAREGAHVGLLARGRGGGGQGAGDPVAGAALVRR